MFSPVGINIYLRAIFLVAWCFSFASASELSFSELNSVVKSYYPFNRGIKQISLEKKCKSNKRGRESKCSLVPIERDNPERLQILKSAIENHHSFNSDKFFNSDLAKIYQELGNFLEIYKEFDECKKRKRSYGGRLEKLTKNVSSSLNGYVEDGACGIKLQNSVLNIETESQINNIYGKINKSELNLDSANLDLSIINNNLMLSLQAVAHFSNSNEQFGVKKVTDEVCLDPENKRIDRCSKAQRISITELLGKIKEDKISSNSIADSEGFSKKNINLVIEQMNAPLIEFNKQKKKLKEKLDEAIKELPSNRRSNRSIGLRNTYKTALKKLKKLAYQEYQKTAFQLKNSNLGELLNTKTLASQTGIEKLEEMEPQLIGILGFEKKVVDEYDAPMPVLKQVSDQQVQNARDEALKRSKEQVHTTLGELLDHKLAISQVDSQKTDIDSRDDLEKAYLELRGDKLKDSFLLSPVSLGQTLRSKPELAAKTCSLLAEIAGTEQVKEIAKNTTYLVVGVGVATASIMTAGGAAPVAAMGAALAASLAFTAADATYNYYSAKDALIEEQALISNILIRDGTEASQEKLVKNWEEIQEGNQQAKLALGLGLLDIFAIPHVVAAGNFIEIANKLENFDLSLLQNSRLINRIAKNGEHIKVVKFLIENLPANQVSKILETIAKIEDVKEQKKLLGQIATLIKTYQGQGVDWSVVFRAVEEYKVDSNDVQLEASSGRSVERRPANSSIKTDQLVRGQAEIDFEKKLTAGAPGTSHRVYKDQSTGKRYLVKAYESSRTFRSDVDDAVSVLADRLELPSQVNAYKAEIDGEKVTMVELIESEEITDLWALTKNGADYTKLDKNIAEDLVRERFFDWLISNHDPHGGNFLVDQNGNLKGIDKSQAFKYMFEMNEEGGVNVIDNLSLTYNPNSKYNGNGDRYAPAYNKFFQQLAAGEIENLSIGEAKLIIANLVKKLDQIPDSEFREMFQDFAKNYAASSEAPEGITVDQILDALIDRKKSISSDFKNHFREISPREQVGRRRLELRDDYQGPLKPEFLNNEYELSGEFLSFYDYDTKLGPPIVDSFKKHKRQVEERFYKFQEDNGINQSIPLNQKDVVIFDYDGERSFHALSPEASVQLSQMNLINGEIRNAKFQYLDAPYLKQEGLITVPSEMVVEVKGKTAYDIEPGEVHKLDELELALHEVKYFSEQTGIQLNASLNNFFLGENGKWTIVDTRPVSANDPNASGYITPELLVKSFGQLGTNQLQKVDNVESFISWAFSLKKLDEADVEAINQFLARSDIGPLVKRKLIDSLSRENRARLTARRINDELDLGDDDFFLEQISASGLKGKELEEALWKASKFAQIEDYFKFIKSIGKNLGQRFAVFDDDLLIPLKYFTRKGHAINISGSRKGTFKDQLLDWIKSNHSNPTKDKIILTSKNVESLLRDAELLEQFRRVENLTVYVTDELSGGVTPFNVLKPDEIEKQLKHSDSGRTEKSVNDLKFELEKKGVSVKVHPIYYDPSQDIEKAVSTAPPFESGRLSPDDFIDRVGGKKVDEEEFVKFVEDGKVPNEMLSLAVDHLRFENFQRTAQRISSMMEELKKYKAENGLETPTYFYIPGGVTKSDVLFLKLLRETHGIKEEQFIFESDFISGTAGTKPYQGATIVTIDDFVGSGTQMAGNVDTVKNYDKKRGEDLTFIGFAPFMMEEGGRRLKSSGIDIINSVTLDDVIETGMGNYVQSIHGTSLRGGFGDSSSLIGFEYMSPDNSAPGGQALYRFWTERRGIK